MKQELKDLKAQGYAHFMKLEAIRQQTQMLEIEAKKEMEAINRINQEIDAIEKPKTE